MSERNNIHRSIEISIPGQEIERSEQNMHEIISQAIIEGTFIDSGKQGVVLRVTIDDDYVDDDGEHRTGEAATKILKIDSPESARREDEMHRVAFEVLAKFGNQHEVAQIPRMHVVADMQVQSEELQHTLTHVGVDRTVGENISVLVMEYISGKTFARYIYEQVARRHAKLRHLGESVKEMSMTDLQEHIAGALDFHLPGGKHADPGLLYFEREKVFGENIKKMIGYLAKTDFVLPDTILKRVQNTVNLLHQHNFFHRDLHEKNIMLTERDDGSIDEVFLIDFGLSTVDSDGTRTGHNPYHDPLTGQDYMKDETINTRYATLGFSLEMRKMAEKRATEKRLRGLKPRILKKYPQLFDSIEAQLLRTPEDIDRIARTLAVQVAKSSVGDLYSEVQALSVMELCAKSQIHMIDYLSYITTRPEYKNQVSFVGMIRDLAILKSVE